MSSSTSTSAHPENQQRPSSSHEDVVFVAHMVAVRGAMQAYGVVDTRGVYRARGAVPEHSVGRGRRGHPIRGTWGPVRSVATRRGGCEGVGGRPFGSPSGAQLGGPSGDRSVMYLGRGAKRSRSLSSSDEDVLFLGQVVAGTGGRQRIRRLRSSSSCSPLGSPSPVPVASSTPTECRHRVWSPISTPSWLDSSSSGSP